MTVRLYLLAALMIAVTACSESSPAGDQGAALDGAAEDGAPDQSLPDLGRDRSPAADRSPAGDQTSAADQGPAVDRSPSPDTATDTAPKKDVGVVSCPGPVSGGGSIAGDCFVEWSCTDGNIYRVECPAGKPACTCLVNGKPVSHCTPGAGSSKCAKGGQCCGFPT